MWDTEKNVMNLVTLWQKEKTLELIDRAQRLTKSSRVRTMSFSKTGANKHFSHTWTNEKRETSRTNRK